jgi:hypothetical protein
MVQKLRYDMKQMDFEIGVKEVDLLLVGPRLGVPKGEGHNPYASLLGDCLNLGRHKEWYLSLTIGQLRISSLQLKSSFCRLAISYKMTSLLGDKSCNVPFPFWA